MKYTASVAAAITAVLFSGCAGGGGSTPGVSYMTRFDKYGGQVVDSKKIAYKTAVDITQTTDFPGRAYIFITFYVNRGPDNSDGVSELYSFYPIFKTEEESYVPVVDSHIHTVMALYPDNESKFGGKPTCHLTADFEIKDRVSIDLSYSSNDCPMVKSGKYQAAYINGYTSTKR